MNHVGTFDGRYINIYFNGELKGNYDFGSTAGIPYLGTTLFISRCFGRMGYFFHGLADEVRIYSRALTPEEIKAQYVWGQKNTDSPPPIEEGLVGYWGFDEGKGKMARNSVSDRDYMFPIGRSEAGVFYPSQTGPIGSRRCEAYREGCQDYLCLYLLSREIERVKKSGLAKNEVSKAEQVLKEAVDKVLAEPSNINLASQYRREILSQIVILSD